MKVVSSLIQDENYRYINYYYTNHSLILQFVTFTTEPLVMEEGKHMEELLNGLQIF